MHRTRPAWSVLTAAGLMTACAPPAPVIVAPVPDAEQLALALEHRTSLDAPIRVLFDWHLNEAGVRVRGVGVARIEPPYKARLDLFMNNGEGVVSAGLVDDDLRLPAGAPDDVLPPADLMWGVLGVFRPRLGLELLGADRLEGDVIRIRYRYADARELHYHIVDSRVRKLELVQDGSVVQRVELGLDAGTRYPLEATYRNMTASAFRELRLMRDSVETVEAYPPDIWDPTGGGAR